MVNVMQSAEQFMELFLREQAKVGAAARDLYQPFEERFYEPDYLALHTDSRAEREKKRETLLTAEDYGEIAKAITTGRGGVPKRYRYHLRRFGTSWRIQEREWECLLCQGTGKQRDDPYETCHGTGWKDMMKNDS
jgi:hypothetical protein